MTTEQLERDSNREVLVDSFDDLLLVKEGLFLMRGHNVEPEKEAHIKALEDEVTDSIILTHEGEIEDGRYLFDGSEEALIGIAKVTALQARKAEEAIEAAAANPVATPPVLSVSSSPSSRNVEQRITSFFDPRLDEKPRRWFRK